MRKFLSLRLDTRGIAAVEFALVAPVLVLLFIGGEEVTTLVRAQMKVNHVAGLLAKMVSQQTSVTGGAAGTVGNLCYGAGLAMTPLATGAFAGAIASVTTSASGSGTTTVLDWESDNSCATTATAMGASGAVSLATGAGLVPNAGDSIIIVKASYTYSAVTHVFLPANSTLTQTIYARPRSNATIPCSNCS